MQHPELHQRIHDSFMRQGMMQHLVHAGLGQAGDGGVVFAFF
jgi:hypothetical protein